MARRPDPNRVCACVATIALGIGIASCAAPTAQVTPPIPEAVAPPTATASREAEPTPPASSAEPTAPAARAAPPFPPANYAPPIERTKSPGDGVWQAIATGDATPVLYRSTVHPHALKRNVYVVVVAIDLSRVGLELVAGTVEPPPPTATSATGTGLVADADKSDLLAVFNGGFMAKHGHYGMMVDGVTLLPPRDEACTVALVQSKDTTEHVQIATWPRLALMKSALRAYRQTPPCLLEDGVVHPEIDSQLRPRKWSGSVTGEYDVRRSALGLDSAGTTLFYGLGESVTPHDLADAMKAAGASVAAELDINWSYTRFLVYGRPGQEKRLRVTDTLIPKIKYSPLGYVEKPAERDFFYLKRARP